MCDYFDMRCVIRRTLMAPRKKLGELLIEEGLIDELQLSSAIGHQKNWGGKLGSALVELGFLREEDIAKVLEEQLRQHCLSEKELRPEPEALKLVSMDLALKHNILPLKVKGNELLIAMSNPYNFEVIDELGFTLGKRIKGVLALDSGLKRAIKQYYGGGATGYEYRSVSHVADTGEQPEIVHYGSAKDIPPPREPEPESKRVEPSPDLIAKALAYLLIEKGIIKRDELIEKMKTLKDKGLA